MLHAANCERRPPPHPVGGDQAVAANHDPFRFAGEVGLHDINLGARQVPAGAGRGTDRDNRSLRSIPLVISTRCEIDGPRPSSGRGPRDTPSPQL